MAVPYSASMPPNFDLTDNYTVRLTAVDATTGAVVTAVKVSSLAAEAVSVSGGAIGSTPGFTVTPLLAYTPGVT